MLKCSGLFFVLVVHVMILEAYFGPNVKVREKVSAKRKIGMNQLESYHKIERERK